MYVAHVLLSFRRVAVASPKYLQKNGTPKDPRALEKHALLAQHAAWRFTKEGEEVAVEARGALRTNTPYVLRECALRDLGIAFVPDWLVGADLESGKLRRLFPEHTTPELTAYAIYRVDLKSSLRVRTFVRELKQVF